MKKFLDTLFSSEKKWITLAVIFFIVWKFFLIGVLWHDRAIPPEPDDAYIYIAHIASVSECSNLLFCNDSYYSLENHRGYEYLSYRFFFGLLAHIVSLTASQVFFLSFFIGTLLIVPVFLYLGKKLGIKKDYFPLLIILLALYHGSPYYHGFWWVTPIFFSTLLFFLILGITFDESIKKYWLPLFLLIPLLIFSHPMGIYFSLLIPLIVSVSHFFERKLTYPLLKKLLFFLFIVFIFYTPIAYYLQTHTIDQNPYGIENVVAEKSLTSFYGAHALKYYSSNFVITNNYYFKWLFLHSLPGVAFLLTMLFFILRSRCTRLLGVYISLFFIILTLSIINPYGYRFLILLWPITYLVYGIGSFEAVKFFLSMLRNNPRLRFIFITLAVIISSIFILVNIVYAYLYNDYMNKLENISFLPKMTSYLEESTHGAIYSNEKVINSRLAITSLRPRLSESISHSETILLLDRSATVNSMEHAKLHKLYLFFAPYLNLTPETNIPVPETFSLPSDFTKSQEFGSISIYMKE